MERDENAAAADEPQLNYRGWKSMPFVIGNETFEKLGTTGTSSNLLIYFTTVFNMKSITAATVLSIFHATTNFATLMGAFLCDAYFGRYKTLGFASVASFLGMLVLTLTAALSQLHPPSCSTQESGICRGPTLWQMAFLLSGLGFLVIGGGGIRPCNLAFGADQFNPNTESGKKGISSFFNWYYFTFSLAMMISSTIIVYVQSEVSWAWGLAIPAILMFASCALFFLGSRLYVKVQPNGSPFTGIVQVVVAATKKRHLELPEQPWLSLHNHIPRSCINSQIPYTEQFRFLDKAAIVTPDDQINPDGSPTNSWKLCSMQQVEQLKCILRVLPIWISTIIYHVASAPPQTYVLFQAGQSDRRLGSSNFKISPASYVVFTMVSMTLWIPVYDRIVVPFLQKITGKEGGITLLQRVGVGFAIAIINIIISAIVEEHRRTVALTKPTLGIQPRQGAISAMSGLWFVPQLALAGVGEAFANIGQVEFYYNQFPENMRSIAGALFYCGSAVSGYLSSLLINIVHQMTRGAATGNWLPEDLNKGRLDYFYYMMAGLATLNFCYFLACSRWYKYKEIAAMPLMPMERQNDQINI